MFYAKAPDNVRAGDCVWFKAKNALINVTVGGEERARIDFSENNVLYGKTVGTDWVCVPLETSDRGKLIAVNFTACYNDKSAYIDEAVIGQTTAALRNAINERVFSSVICLLILFTGIIFIAVYLILRPHINNMPQDLLCIGASTVFTLIWSFSELRAVQIISDHSGGIIHNLTCMTLMMIALPILYYFKNDLDKICKAIIPAITAVPILNFSICCILHFTGIADFHETLTFTHIAIGLMAACIVGASIFRCFAKNRRSVADIFAAFTMILLGVAAIVDITRYNSGAVNDSAFFTRIAVFFYIMTLGTGNLIYVADMARKGLKTDIISRLAYEDGLTGLGNRTAYTEAVEEISGREITVFVFDINNLKYVNDNMGHIAGDKLIKAGADIISGAFGGIGKCYRTGGDEFVCIAEGDVNGKVYSEDFYNRIKDFNAKGELEFPLMIAIGYENYSGSGSFKDVIDSADKKMYEKKAELKKGENGIYARESLVRP